MTRGPLVIQHHSCSVQASSSVCGWVRIRGCHRLNAGAAAEGGTQFVHGRSRLTIDPRIPTMPGRSTSAFHQSGRHCLHQARSAMRCSASMKGELHPSQSRSYDGLLHLVPNSLLMSDSTNGLPCFLVWPLQRKQWVLLCNCLVLPCSHCLGGGGGCFNVYSHHSSIWACNTDQICLYIYARHLSCEI